MSIDQLNKNDVISTTPDDKVMLTISDHHAWDDEGKHLLQLQDKLNAYLQFIESGQILEDYPGAKNKEFIISLAVKYIPNENALLFLSRSRESILHYGFEFEWKVISSSDSSTYYHSLFGLQYTNLIGSYLS